MQRSKVEVLRSNPRSRRQIKGLVGSLHITIASCSKTLGDPIDSYLHIGSGQQLTVSIDEDDAKTLLKKHKDLLRALPEVRLESEFTPFVEANRMPVIPGSSIKGNVRSRIELSLRAKDNKVRACFIRASPPAPKPRHGTQGWRHYEIWENVLSEDRGNPCSHMRGAPVCLVCDIFGSPSLTSLVSFSDAVGQNVKLQPLKLQYGLNLLAAPPSSKFTGRVDFESLKPHELGLLLIGMGVLESRRGKAVLLGRLKYQSSIDGYSLGKVTYSVDALELSPLSESFEGAKPRSRLSEGKLDDTIRKMVEAAKHEFERELIIGDEVMKVAELK